MESVLYAIVWMYRWILTGAVAADARPLLTMSPATGDINVMIVVAVILIALFLLFVLWKGRRRRGG